MLYSSKYLQSYRAYDIDSDYFQYGFYLMGNLDNRKNGKDSQDRHNEKGKKSGTGERAGSFKLYRGFL
jgi:hypothetical protein